jgi:hypothetical protein
LRARRERNGRNIIAALFAGGAAELLDVKLTSLASCAKAPGIQLERRAKLPAHE